MTLSEFERRLQSVNPRLHIKKYGTSMAGVHLGNKYLFRVPQGEIHYYNETVERIGYNSEMITPENPSGKYGYQFLLKRGRYDLARLLAANGHITWAAVAKVASI